MTLVRRLAAAGLVAALACAAAAAPGQAPQNDPRTRDELRDNIATLRLLRMTQVLNLTEDQEATLYPALVRLERRKAELQRRLHREIAALRLLVRGGRGGDEALLAAVRSVDGLQAEGEALDREIAALLAESLTPMQRARYILFSVDFLRGLGEQLGRARRIRRP